MESSRNANERSSIYVENKKLSEEQNLNENQENIKIEENNVKQEEKKEKILEEKKNEDEINTKEINDLKENKKQNIDKFQENINNNEDNIKAKEINDLEENKKQNIDKFQENINNIENKINAKEIKDLEENKKQNIDIKTGNENDDNEEEKMIKENIKNDEINQQSHNEMQYNNSLIKIVEKYNIEKLPDNYDREEATYKVLFLGDSGVGKSSLVMRGIKDKFDSIYSPTIGLDLLNYIVKINERIIKIQLWDTCGQEEFSMCNQTLFKNVSLVIMVYSISNKKTYENIKKWMERVKELSKENAILFLIGNKSDLSNQREVNFMEAKKWGNEEFQFFVETSSKFGDNVDILFKEIVINLYENKLKNESIEEKRKESSYSDHFFSDEQTSSFLNSFSVRTHKSKKCLKCC